MQEPHPDQADSDELNESIHELSAVMVAARVENDFGMRVRETRTIRGMTQRQLADAVGLDASAISRLEQGSRAIRLGEAALIADALKTDVKQLVYGDSSDDPRLELYSAHDELEHATAQLRDATRAAEVSLDHLKTALENSDVREHLSTSPVDVENVIAMCSYVLELLFEHDHPRLLRQISAELVDMDQPNITAGSTDEPAT
ncbi:helix-turn-helix domain-containing protein [Mycobacterium sp. MBM]|nr:helix-turn-helix domain-containing protein [Mycobacterium sp. MBM]